MEPEVVSPVERLLASQLDLLSSGLLVYERTRINLLTNLILKKKNSVKMNYYCAVYTVQFTQKLRTMTLRGHINSVYHE
jgi:hypothetical protein